MDIAPWIITVFTVIAIYFLDKSRNKYLRLLFNWIPAILLAYILPAIITAISGSNYADDGIHQYSKNYFIPLAIVTVMSSLSLRQLKSIGWKPIIIFFSGSLWIALFPVIIAFLFLESDLIGNIFVDQGYWKGLPPIVGSWIGGSTSQLVLKEIVECPENIFLTILILDNILVNIWTILMFQGIKKSDFINKILGITNLMMPDELTENQERKLNPLTCLISLISIVLITNYLIDIFIFKIVVLSIIGLIIGNFISSWNYTFALKFGSILILTVMAILGLKLSFNMFSIEIDLVVFLIVWLVSHYFLMLLMAKILNVNSAWVPIASMANVGGIATAPAVTAAYQKKWMPHAILLAILSMATGTFWGMLTIFLLRNILGH